VNLGFQPEKIVEVSIVIDFVEVAAFYMETARASARCQ
jgi:hypothetical protein